MKLIVSSADYGMLDSVTDGTLKAIRDGILTTINVHTNNSSFFRAASLIKEYPHIAIGQEINFVSGVPISDPVDAPTLVNQDGRLMTSSERQHKHLGSDQISYDEALHEAVLQVERFIKVFGKKPLFMNGHSFGTMQTRLAIADAAEQFGIMLNGFSDPLLKNDMPNWYKQVAGNKSAYTMDMQMNTDVEQWILEDRLHLLEREYGVISTHCGFCDEELVRMSTFNVIRTKEVYALCSDRVKRWISDHGIELINLEQFYLEHPSADLHRADFLAPHPGWTNR